MNISAEVIGFENIIKGLQRLDPVTRRRMIKQALPEGAHLIKLAAAMNAPEDTGALRESILSSKPKFRRGLANIFIGAFSSKAVSKYAFHVETGHGIGPSPGELPKFDERGNPLHGEGSEFRASIYRARIGDTRTRVGPQPFMRRAFDSHYETFFQLVGQALSESLAEAMRV